MHAPDLTPSLSPQRSRPSEISRENTGKSGVSLKILKEHILNTAPFYFVEPRTRKTFTHCGEVEGLPLLEAADKIPFLHLWKTADVESTPSHLLYYQLCVSAHWLTCATFVPTDVDNQIRFRLWDPSQPLEVLQAMADFVLDVRQWPETAFSHNLSSRRWVISPQTATFLSGHQGEWFSIAAAAYGALRTRDPVRAEKLAEQIRTLKSDHARAFLEFRKARDGIGALTACALIAHNLGDLTRVLDVWKVPAEDALREPAAAFAQVDSLYKKYMADENPRHFALRKSRGLRRSHRFLVGMGPFFDDWGQTLVSELKRTDGHREGALLAERDFAELAEHLVDGWLFLKSANRQNPQQNPQAYARALAGILETYPGGANALLANLPSRVQKLLKAGELRTEISVSRSRFTEKWNHFGLTHV